MTTATLLPLPNFVAYDAIGEPLSGGLVYTYVPGGTTPKTTWQDAGETTPNSNPITLSATGSAAIYGSGQYQITTTDSLGNLIPAYCGLSQDLLSLIPSVTNLMPVVLNIAALRAATSNTLPQGEVYVQGYYAGADGGEGPFWYNSADTTSADNGGTIIVDASTRRWYRELGGQPMTWRQFGAKGVGSSFDDTTAMQACINVAQVTGYPINGSSPGSYYTASGLFITAHIALRGGGYQADAGLFWVHNQNLTQGTGWRSGVIVCAPTVNAVTILTNDAVEIDGVTIIYPTPASPNSGISGILCQGIQSTGNLQIGTKISNCWISGADHSITMSNCYAWFITDCLITEHQTFGIYITNSTGSDFGSYGDYNISGNQFWSGSVTSPFAHILLSAGGAGRISNNKLNTGGSVNVAGTAGIEVSNNTGVNVVFEPLTIENNSIEGLGVGINLFQNGGVSNIANVNIVGNQIWCPTPISVSGGVNWLYMTTITGNILEAQAPSGARCLNLTGVTNLTVSGNVFEVNGGSGAIAIFRGANCTNIRQSANVAAIGVDITSGFTAPAVPGSTSAATNTSTMTMVAYVNGGTGTLITVNSVGIFGQSPASFQHSVTLNPGDTIAVTYTSAPTWVWTPVSP